MKNASSCEGAIKAVWMVEYISEPETKASYIITIGRLRAMSRGFTFHFEAPASKVNDWSLGNSNF
jgi:hypothetical protein